MYLVFETEKDSFPVHVASFPFVSNSKPISDPELERFESTILLVASDLNYDDCKRINERYWSREKEYSNKDGYWYYLNFKLELFRRSEFLEKIKKTKENNFVFISNYLTPDSLKVLNELKNFKAKRITYAVGNFMGQNRILSFLEDVSNPHRLLSIGKELLKIQNDENCDKKKNFDHILYDKSLLEILQPDLFSSLTNNKIVNDKIFILSDSELLTEETVKLLVYNLGFPYYQSVYDKLPKEFGEEFTALVFAKLDRIMASELNTLNYNAVKWLGKSKEKRVIMQGDEKSYETIKNYGYELIKLPKYFEIQNKLTEVLLALTSRYKKQDFYPGFPINYLIKYNVFKNLLKDFTSLEQMKDAITNSNNNFYLDSISAWDRFLKDVPSQDKSVAITSPIPSKTYKFEHNEGSEFWKISDSDGKFSYNEFKYKNHLEIKYFLYITKYCYNNKISSETVVEAVGSWHGKNISKLQNLTAEKRKDNKNTFGHLIHHKLSILKKNMPELKEITKRFTTDDYCYYEPDKMNEIKIDLFDPSFPPKSASLKKKK